VVPSSRGFCFLSVWLMRILVFELVFVPVFPFFFFSRLSGGGFRRLGS